MCWELGRWGGAMPRTCATWCPMARLVAIADVAFERARQTATELEIDNSYSSLEAMLECKGLDAVVIATPDKFHPAAVKMVAVRREKYPVRKAACAQSCGRARVCSRRFRKPKCIFKSDLCGVTILHMPQP